MIPGQLWMKPKILADCLDDVPNRPEGVVWEFWARPGNDAMDRRDHRKVITPDISRRELMNKEAAQKMKECGDRQ
jgi:hypothetical protein